MVVAHRGASRAAPENTLSAYRLAISQNAEGVECDITLSKDGHPVLMHDETLERTAGVPGRVSAYRLSELQAMEVGSWKNAAYAGEPIPHLDEFLEVVRGRTTPFVEIKPEAGSPRQVAAALRDALLRAAIHPKDVVVLSFAKEMVQAAKEALPNVRTMFLVENTPTRKRQRDALLASCKKDGVDILGVENVGPSLDRSFFRAAHRSGIAVYVWTVDDPSEMKRLVEAGADSIATNTPKEAIFALQKR